MVSAGAAYVSAKEALPGADFLKLGVIHPLPIEAVRRVAATVDRLFVVEELEPDLEEQLLAAGIAVVAIAAVPPLKAGEQGTLDGSGTRDPFGTAMTYEWTQTAGPAATITDTTSAVAHFKAPSVGGKPQTLTFRLQVQNGNGLRSTGTTTVTVNPGPCGCGAGAGGPGLALALLVLERVIRRRRR